MGEVGGSLVGFRGQDSGEAPAGAARLAMGWQVGRSWREAQGWVLWERTQNKVGGLLQGRGILSLFLKCPPQKEAGQ